MRHTLHFYLGVLFLLLVSGFIVSVAQAEPAVTVPPPRALIAEPTIRVGLAKLKKSVQFTSTFPYQVFGGTSLRGEIPAGEMATLSYKNGRHLISSPSFEFGSEDYLRLVPLDPANYFTLPDLKRTLPGRNKTNYNSYRGTLEFRYSPRSKQPYIFNELPLEEYLQGIAESADQGAVEYLRALLIAARSYAYSNISFSPPTDKRLFDVFANTNDQLYLGYNAEVTRPNGFDAVSLTEGEMVTYKGKVVGTPYFAHSNGKTVSSKKKWGGADRPWLQGVEAPYDKKYKTMWGHGVGMSQHDAEQHALKDGWLYDRILEYYYTGVEIEKVY